ncbi:MAG TPA: radical SAM protein [Proteobacteria bacterium]|nr:radical SAM protein [Pseudomonadota bacterium]
MTMAIYRNLKRITDVKTVSAPPTIAWNFIKNNFVFLSKRPSLPRAMCIYVTYRCNMRCRICGIWKQNHPDYEMTLRDLSGVLSDPLFSRLEYININGGEPLLRNDLFELAALFIKKFKHLRTITINSNGLSTDRAISNVERISRLCRENDIRFSISISLHKIGEGYDEIAGIRNAYSRVIKTLRALREIRDQNMFYLGINCVITNFNVFDLYEMLKWSDYEEIPINFTLGEVRDRFDNLEMKENIEIRGEGRDFLIRFFRKLGKEKSLFNHHALRYKELADIIEFNSKRTLSCHYAMGGLILGSEGLLYYCKKSKAIGNCRERSAYSIYYGKSNLKYREKELLEVECKKCPPNTFNRIELEKDLLKYLKFLIFT